MPLTENSNAHAQLKEPRETTQYTRNQYDLNYMIKPSLDRSGWWSGLMRDIENLPSLDLRQQLVYLLHPHLDPRPEDIKKCRDTLRQIQQNIGTIIHFLAPLLQPDVPISTGVTYQGADMTDNDIIKGDGSAGPVLQLDRSIYGKEYWTSGTMHDYVERLERTRRDNRNKPDSKKESDPVAARVIKQAGRVVGYYMHEYSYGMMQGIAQIRRIGADPAMTPAAVHTALVADMLLNIRTRFPFDTVEDSYSEEQTTMVKITQ